MGGSQFFGEHMFSNSVSQAHLFGSAFWDNKPTSQAHRKAAPIENNLLYSLEEIYKGYTKR